MSSNKLNARLDKKIAKCIEIINKDYDIEASLVNGVVNGDRYKTYNLSFSYEYTTLNDILKALYDADVIQCRTIIEANEVGIFLSFGVGMDFIDFCRTYFEDDEDFYFLKSDFEMED